MWGGWLGAAVGVELGSGWHGEAGAEADACQISRLRRGGYKGTRAGWGQLL